MHSAKHPRHYWYSSAVEFRASSKQATVRRQIYGCQHILGKTKVDSAASRPCVISLTHEVKGAKLRRIAALRASGSH
jgi:hypothetical protein